MNWRERQHTPEQMDGPCDYETFRGCLADLARVNTWTLAYRPTLHWLKQFASAQALSILDVGSGYGDVLRRIATWARRGLKDVRLSGVDLNPYSARAAGEVASSIPITYVTANAFDYNADSGVDIIISSLFTHHLTDPQIVQFLRWMEATARRGWFINDLHRHPVPYHFFRLWARLVKWHPFVQTDGPISITRAFTRADWRRLLAEAGLLDVARITWWFPFRYTVGRVK